MKEPVISKLTGHVWRTREFTQEEMDGDPFVITAHRRRIGMSAKKVLFCERCGFVRGMNYPPPDEVLKYLNIPMSCDEFIASSIHDI